MIAAQTFEKTSLRTVDPIADPAWSKLVDESPSMVYHSPSWMRAIRDTYGFAFRAAILETPIGQPGRATAMNAPGQVTIAGVPWGEPDDLMGRRRITLPFSDLCNIIAPSAADANTLARSVLGDGVRWTLRSTLGSFPCVDAPVAARTAYKWQWIDLTADESTLWRRIVKSTRMGVRKAEREGVVIRQAQDKSDLRAWYLLHLRLRKHKYHLLAQSYRFFEELWDSFVEPGRGFLLLGTYKGQIINGAFCLLWKDICTYKFSTSDPEFLVLRPNNVLHWQAMLLAKSKGYRILDHGRSKAKQEGLLAFKRAFGAQEEDILAATFGGPEVGDNRRQAISRVLNDVTEMFVNESVPDDATERAGERLYRYFA